MPNPQSIKELADQKFGGDIAAAIAHNNSAINQGGDLNGDGYVNNDEWDRHTGGDWDGNGFSDRDGRNNSTPVTSSGRTQHIANQQATGNNGGIVAGHSNPAHAQAANAAKNWLQLEASGFDAANLGGAAFGDKDYEHLKNSGWTDKTIGNYLNNSAVDVSQKYVDMFNVDQSNAPKTPMEKFMSVYNDTQGSEDWNKAADEAGYDPDVAQRGDVMKLGQDGYTFDSTIPMAAAPGFNMAEMAQLAGFKPGDKFFDTNTSKSVNNQQFTGNIAGFTPGGRILPEYVTNASTTSEGIPISMGNFTGAGISREMMSHLSDQEFSQALATNPQLAEGYQAHLDREQRDKMQEAAANDPTPAWAPNPSTPSPSPSKPSPSGSSSSSNTNNYENPFAGYMTGDSSKSTGNIADIGAPKSDNTTYTDNPFHSGNNSNKGDGTKPQPTFEPPKSYQPVVAPKPGDSSYVDPTNPFMNTTPTIPKATEMTPPKEFEGWTKAKEKVANFGKGTQYTNYTNPYM